jgi:hypothetical protein
VASIENRPYVGTWQLNAKQVVRHTPDALVYVNGDTALPGCLNCNGRIDIQKYITQVSVDPSTQGPATASISMHIPRQSVQSLWRDGDFILHPGLEVNIYMRGYFPVKGVLSNVAESTNTFDPTQAVTYPYYHVFHGVVTEVSHEYSGTDHTVSLSCADLLHFWQYIRVSTSASYFGSRPKNSKNRMSFVGHNFTGMTPYGIMYSLWRDVFGAAGGAEAAFLGNSTNASAKNNTLSESQYSMTQLYWAKRFGETIGTLRMYGVDGSLFNAFQQAYLGSLKSKQVEDLLSGRFADKGAQETRETDPWAFQIESLVWGQDTPPTEGGESSGLSAGTMQAFIFDIGNIGVNLYESQYQSKMEIMSTITEMTGYEFYMDVDGDIVFKPPMYNLDTSSSRTYRIEPIDLISFSAREGEPEATVVKATASGGGANIGGLGLEGEMGKRAEFIDYRLVAQFGWRQQTFETAYHGNARAMYYTCINRLDLFNIAVKSASCAIPLRPELRPGYPVYIAHLDCFYYCQAFNHSFSYGGACQTNLTLVGKRAKFHAPGIPPLTRKANISDIRLDNTFLPKLPLQVEDNNKLPALQGFPNVVLALDPHALNPLFYAVGSAFSFGNDEGDQREQLRALISTAISKGVLTHNGENAETTDQKTNFFDGPFQLQIANGEYVPIPGETELLTQLASVQAAAAEVDSGGGNIVGVGTGSELVQQSDAAVATTQTALNTLITAVQSELSRNFSDADSTASYLDLLDDLKSNFSPGTALPGHYRYYSASHPDAEQQGQAEIVADEEGGTRSGSLTLLENSEKVFGFTVTAGEGAAVTSPATGGGVTVTAGLPVMQAGTKDVLPTPTHKIQTVAFCHHNMSKRTIRLGRSGMKALNFSKAVIAKPTLKELEEQLASLSYSAATTVAELYQDFYDEREIELSISVTSLNVDFTTILFSDALLTLRAGTPNEPDAAIGGPDEDEGLVKTNTNAISRHLVQVLSEQASTILCLAEQARVEQFGHWGQKPPEGVTPDTKEREFNALQIEWDHLQFVFAPRQVQNTTGGLAVKRVTVPTAEKSFYSPVFPVSDERGYEVIGSYKYGRGLSIEPGGSMEKLTLLDLAFDELSAAEVHEIVTELQNEGDVAKVVGTLDPRVQARICAALTVESGDEATATSFTLTDIKPGNDAFNNAFVGKLASSADWSQKATVVNSAYSLGDIQNTLREDICSCKGAEADVLLLAFNPENFVDLGQPDDVSNYVANVMVDKSLSWEASQQALRGAVLDRDSQGLAEEIGALSDAFSGGAGPGLGQQIQNALDDNEG